MGERLLRGEVQALRQLLEALPSEAKRIQRLDLEDNVVEFKFFPSGGPSPDRGKRLTFLVYEADMYPNSGGVVMSEDEQDEELVESINDLLQADSLSIVDAIKATCSVLGITDPALLSCLASFSSGGSSASAVSGAADGAGSLGARPMEAESGIMFEGEDEEGSSPSYSMYIGSVADREHRPGWKKLKWQEIEEQRVARRKEQTRRAERMEPGHGTKRRKGLSPFGGAGEMTLEEQKAAGEQMWSSQEAFAILANELYQLQTEADPSLSADAVDYDVHHWVARLSTCEGRLGEDLAKLKALHGYDYIELHLSFKEDLHPFYPPTASIVRPRLQGKHDVLAALACHPRLQLRGWSPFQTTQDLLRSILRFFETIATVDLGNPQNDMAQFPDGAFSPIERQLAQLGSLCEIVPLDLRVEQPGNPYQEDPWARDEVLTQSSLGAMLARKKEQERAAGGGSSKTFWAAGTGYGHDAGSKGNTWDPQAMRAVQVAQDEELQQLVRSISDSLRDFALALPAASDGGKAFADLLSKSCLTPFLARELSTSYTNMGDRLPFFKEVYRLLQELMRAIPVHAGTVLELARPHVLATKASSQTFRQSLGSSASRVDLADDVAFAELAVTVADEVERLCGSLPAGDGSHEADAVLPDAPASEALSAAAEDAAYCQRLGPLQLDQWDFGTSHTYAHSATAETVAPQARTVRLAKELAGLSSLLPMSASSSVFVRVDLQRQQLWRVLVTGPDDTPYSSGCFVFDFYFPPQYPMEPPRVKLLTTGHHTVTFNPNLYESGKVCLSLLGTWKGDRGESWDAMTSRVMQVLVSIQSLILVPDPYFNEPGYEREIGTKQGERKSREYSMPVREGCVRWAMLEHLQKRPSPSVECCCFSDVFREHFRLRAQRVKDVCASWVAEAETHGATTHRAALAGLLAQLTTELDRVARGEEPSGASVSAREPEVTTHAEEEDNASDKPELSEVLGAAASAASAFLGSASAEVQLGGPPGAAAGAAVGAEDCAPPG